MGPLGIRVLPIPGNHDARDALRAAFPDIARQVSGPFIQYVVDDYPVRLIALDTLQDGQVGGRICPARLQWLAEQLDKSQRPTVLFMHHPPFDYGMEENEDMHCDGADAMARIVSRHSQILAILCGHLHRSTMLRWAGTVACTVPATAPALEIKLDGGHPAGWIDTPPMVGLHLWRAGADLISHIVAVDEPERFTPFAK